MATISFDEKVVVTDPEMMEKMKRDIEGESMMTDEEVKKGLEEIALITNWGGVERIDGVPKPIVVVKDALALINRLEEENERVLYEAYCSATKAEGKTAQDILTQFAPYRAASPALSATWYALAEKYGVTE